MTVPLLGLLAEPTAFHGPLEITGRDGPELIRHLRMMLLIRLVEERLANMRQDGHIGGPVHLGIGQEAVAVGVSHSLCSSDMVFGAHRSHSHLLAMGGSVHGLFAEILGRDTGVCHGMGGSMHLWDEEHGFFGSVPIVAGTVPLAVGAALAAKLKRTDAVAVAYFGDGACEEGAVQESLNLARMLNVPVLFVVENNLFSSHMHIRLRQPFDSTARFAVAHDVPHQVVDGNDVLAVADAAARLIGAARAGQGPGFLEAVTFRWLGHVDWRVDADVGVERSADDLVQWRKRDPVSRLELSLENAGLWSREDGVQLRTTLRAEIDAAWEKAMSDPWPPADSLLDCVYASQRPHD
jgi:TPP-dependent pyruvate/acetoin dehydrogenase alpha subunit